MSFLEQLKAQKGLGKKPPIIKTVETVVKSESIDPNKRIDPKGKFPVTVGVDQVILADGNLIDRGDLYVGIFILCRHCGKVSKYPNTTVLDGRFCSTECRNNYCSLGKGLKLIKPAYTPQKPAFATAKPVYAPPADKPITSSNTREQWLESAYKQINMTLLNGEAPRCRVSVGFPAGSRPKTVQKTLGQYWPSGSASDGVPQIFISPSKSASGDPVEMLAVLLHEMIHACTPGKGHGKEFKAIAKRVGLNGPMRSTTPGPLLRDKLKLIASVTGSFPHGTIDPTTRPGKKGKLKGYECPSCKFKLYTTQKWIDISGGSIECPNVQCGCDYMTFIPPK